MKRTIHGRIIISLVVCCIVLISYATARAAADGTKSLRDFLVNSKYVVSVYPIDDYHTFVVPETNMITSAIKGDFDDDFLAFCKAKGTLESRFLMSDPLTGKESDSWKVLELDKKNNYTNPKSGDREEFKPDMLYKGIPVKNSKTPAPVRIRNYMEIAGVFYLDKDKPRAFIVRTNDKQPFVYKADSLPAYNKLTMPMDGDLARNVTEIRKSREGGLLSRPKQLFKDADIFVYLTALCKKFNLTPGYAINEGEFVPVAEATTKYLVDDKWQSGYFKVKLKEITSPADMFKFMADLGHEKNKFGVWYFWAAGDKKFVSKGEEERNVGDKGIVNSRFQVVFANDRGMEGIEYKREQKKGDAVTTKDTTVKKPEPEKKDSAPAQAKPEAAPGTDAKK